MILRFVLPGKITCGLKTQNDEFKLFYSGKIHSQNVARFKVKKLFFSRLKRSEKIIACAGERKKESKWQREKIHTR
jgi:hypothetical protein